MTRLLAHAVTELVTFTSPPYAWQMPEPTPAVQAMLGYGARARSLYLSSKWADPAAEFREEMAVCHDAGVQARLADQLPVVDREVAMVPNPNRAPAEVGYRPALLVEDAAFASAQAAAFERTSDTSASGLPV